MLSMSDSGLKSTSQRPALFPNHSKQSAMSIKLDDINFNIQGFIVPAIKKATDAKLRRLEEELTDTLYQTNWANIDDLQCLSVSWTNTHWLNDEEKKTVCAVLNKLFKLKNNQQ